jgi:hypothetical protein
MWTYGSSIGQTAASNGTADSNLTQLNYPEALSVDIKGETANCSFGELS